MTRIYFGFKLAVILGGCMLGTSTAARGRHEGKASQMQMRSLGKGGNKHPRPRMLMMLVPSYMRVKA